VIAIIAILAAAVIVALNPARQFSQARNSTRSTHVATILSAIQQNAADNSGTFTCAAGAVPTTSTAMKATGGYDICGCIVPTFLSSLPFDPSAAGAKYTSCTDYNTGYQIIRDTTSSRITVSASSAELGKVISASE